MPCYCKDLSKIKHDIASFNSIISYYKSIKNRSSSINTALGHIGAEAKTALDPVATGSYESNIKELGAPLVHKISSLIDDATNQIEILQNKYDYLKGEDAQYHAQQNAARS